MTNRSTDWPIHGSGAKKTVKTTGIAVFSMKRPTRNSHCQRRKTFRPDFLNPAQNLWAKTVSMEEKCQNAPVMKV